MNDKVLNNVPRELLEQAAEILADEGWEITAHLIRALLSEQPQASASQSAPAGEREAPATMPEILYGPATHVTWTPDHTPKEQRRQVVLVDAEQFAAWQRAQSAPAGTVPEERDNPDNMDALVRKYARHAAWVFGNAQGLKYTPKNAAEAESFEPHGWVVHAIWSAFEDGKAYQAGRVNSRMRDYGIVLAAAPQPVSREWPDDEIVSAWKWCEENGGTPAEFLSHSLLVKRSRVLGRPLTWREAIELTAMTTNMPDEQRDKLLAMDDEPEAARQEQGDEVQRLREALVQIAETRFNWRESSARAMGEIALAALTASTGQEVKP